MGTVAVFGGTFNPIHIGHVQMIETLCKQEFIDKVLIIPTKIPPHKETVFLASEQDRINLCSIIANKFVKAEVSNIELRREGKSYSVDTVLELKKQYPNSKIAITVGADMLIYFTNWFRFETILQNADIITFYRADSNENDYNDEIENLKKLGANIICLNQEIANISSTQIRNLLCSGNVADHLLDLDVATYIKEHQVYGKM